MCQILSVLVGTVKPHGIQDSFKLNAKLLECD